MSNMEISSECVELSTKEVVEQEDFLKLRENLVARNVVENGDCHCSRVSPARENLEKCKVQIT